LLAFRFLRNAKGSILGGAELDVETVEGYGQDPRQADPEGHGAFALAEEDSGDLLWADAELRSNEGAGQVGVEADGRPAVVAFAPGAGSKWRALHLELELSPIFSHSVTRKKVNQLSCCGQSETGKVKTVFWKKGGNRPGRFRIFQAPKEPAWSIKR
jgi:hypothetical protein